MSKPTVVITYGTFDLFHIGHVRLLKRLRALGDKLIVGLSSDEFNAIKGKKSFFSYEERKEILLSCKYVDEVFPEYNWEQKIDDVQKYQADIFGMGNDWVGKFDELNTYCKVVYLDRTEDISTTEIKNNLSRITPKQCQELESSLHSALDIIKTVSNSLNLSDK
ncbi:adenylyltransferase/cytidyltransferase family protein [Actinobacillus minor]|uniref:adenylyltransferase/cytidyltransferase family protein n=1 Tax=Actinobacillus minor TaxID=51047 RepID=UPI0023EF82E2|nr:adenylyltransferase/cytidyltransferase family protein [Actinobacillus minor]MDD6911484.1 adenylyltransferase/cytidyltransferase family protein [Actinobacillus minor]MDY4712426.1 adenylyltransferase/cytidyltransferase family protein [Actinobacillus minor]